MKGVGPLDTPVCPERDAVIRRSRIEALARQLEAGPGRASIPRLGRPAGTRQPGRCPRGCNNCVILPIGSGAHRGSPSSDRESPTCCEGCRNHRVQAALVRRSPERAGVCSRSTAWRRPARQRQGSQSGTAPGYEPSATYPSCISAGTLPATTADGRTYRPYAALLPR